MRRMLAGMFALAGPGCGGTEAPTYLEFAEICGVAGPVRMLELEPGERVTTRAVKVGDRVAFGISRAEGDEADRPTPWGSTLMTVWTAGTCGEEPQRLAEGISRFFTVPHWPEVLLACDSSAGTVLALDPKGAAPPHVLFTGLRGCGSHWTRHGLVNVTGAGKVRLYPYPEDPYRDSASSRVLFDRVRTEAGAGLPSAIQLDVFDEFMLAVTPELALVRIELADGAISTVQTGVTGFLADAEGRFVLWQDDAATAVDEGYPAGNLFLRDRGDGSDAFLGQAVLEYNRGALRYFERGYIYLELEPTRVFSWPGLQFVDLPEHTSVVGEIDDQRWLSLGAQGVGVVDLVSGEAKTVYQGLGRIMRQDGNGVEMLRVPYCCGGDITERVEGPLWLIPFEGEARKLAARASHFGRSFADGRRAGMVDITADWRGTLELTDPVTEENLRIDEDVFVGIDVAKDVFGEDVVVYSVSKGERAGVWIARMPPV